MLSVWMDSLAVPAPIIEYSSLNLCTCSYAVNKAPRHLIMDKIYNYYCGIAIVNCWYIHINGPSQYTHNASHAPQLLSDI